MKRSFRNDGSLPYVTQNEFTAYLQTAISRSKARYLRRKEKIGSKELCSSDFMKGSILPLMGDAAFFSDDHDMSDQFEGQLFKSITQLSEREQQVLRLKVFGGLTFDEIARRLGMGPNTAKTVYYRALKKLRHMLLP